MVAAVVSSDPGGVAGAGLLAAAAADTRESERQVAKCEKFEKMRRDTGKTSECKKKSLPSFIIIHSPAAASAWNHGELSVMELATLSSLHATHTVHSHLFSFVFA